jgi:tetratricopeptide (TPR) repeat protein
MTLPRILLAVLLAALAARVAAADDPALRAAKRHFERGEKLYALTKFSDALDEYQQAFDAKPIPDFLFNIGQCYRNLGDYDAAIFSYRKYLKLAPDAPNRDKVEQLISDLSAKRDQSDAQRLGLTRSRATEAPPAEPSGARAPDRATDRAGDRASAPGDRAGPPAGERPDRPDDRPVYKTWWFWTITGVVVVGAGTYALTRSPGPPSTSLGNIVFGK